MQPGGCSDKPGQERLIVCESLHLSLNFIPAANPAQAGVQVIEDNEFSHQKVLDKKLRELN